MKYDDRVKDQGAGNCQNKGRRNKISSHIFGADKTTDAHIFRKTESGIFSKDLEIMNKNTSKHL